MKSTPLLLGVSLAANAALVWTVLRSESTGNGSATKPVAAAVTSVPNVRGDGAVSNSDRPSLEDRQNRAAITPWKALGAETLTEMVSRLRAAGYPVSAIRALVWGRLNEDMAARRKELMAGVEDVPYWKIPSFFLDPKIQAAQRQFYQEEMKIVRELLGPDASDDNEIAQYFRRRQYGNIPASKAEELQRIAGDYGDLRNQIYATSNGMLMPEDREKLTYLDKEMRSDFAAVLTPEELRAYELRSSSTAQGLRSQLTTFQPTEAEYGALFDIARAVEDKFGTMQGPSTAEQMRARQEAVNAEARKVLSPERYTAFEQATDPRYSTLNRIAARYNVPPAVVPQVYSIQQDIMQQARNVPAAERATRMPVLVQEAEAKIRPLLGDQAFGAYQVYGGQWMQSLQRPPGGAGGKG